MARHDGRVAVVTGASSGIGRGVALALAGDGATVVATARTLSGLEATCNQIEAAGGRAVAVEGDVTDEAQVEHVFDRAESLGPVDVLVHAAGVFDGGPIGEVSTPVWRRVVDVNLTGAFLCTRAAMRRMAPRGRGRILLVGSISASVPREESAPYAASKAGLVGLARAAAIEGRRHGVAVGCLHPGNVATGMRLDPALEMNQEPMLSVDEVAGLALAMLSVEQGSNVWELTILPIEQAFLGRG